MTGVHMMELQRAEREKNAWQFDLFGGIVVFIFLFIGTAIANAHDGHDHGPGAFVPVSASKLTPTTSADMGVTVKGHWVNPEKLETRLVNLEKVVTLLLQDRKQQQVVFNTMNNLLVEISKAKAEMTKLRSQPRLKITTDFNPPFLGTMHLNEEEHPILIMESGR